MRMKKLMILAVAAIAMAACTKTYDKVETTEGTPIGFGTWMDVLTKARATGNGNTSFATGDIFKVYGTKHISSDEEVFDGVDVTATVDGSNVSWDYTGKRFWDPSASYYTFYAALPSTMVTALTSEEKTTMGGDYSAHGKFKGGFTFNDPTALNNDVLIAAKTKVVPASGASAGQYKYNSTVNMEFHHIASSLDLKVKQDADLGTDAKVTITALSLVNVKNVGTFATSEYYDAQATATATTDDDVIPHVSWTAGVGTLGTEGVYTILSSSSDTDDTDAAGTTAYTNHVGVTTGTPATLFEKYVFMPQALNAGQKIKLSYTIVWDKGTANDTSDDVTYTYTDVEANLGDFITTDKDNNDGTKIGSWEPRTHYVYTMTIGANAIKFTASVTNWVENAETGYQYLIQ